MQLIRGKARRRDARPIIATIGNFDGMHLGHQAIMQRMKTLAELHSALTCIITFEPMPAEVFSVQNPPPRLHGTRNRIRNMQDCGIDQCLILTFNEQLRSLSASEFIENVLLENLNLHTLIVGDDFRFGNKRAGDISTLQQAGAEHGFDVEDTPTVLHNGERISSSLVRTALKNRNLQQAADLLGRPYEISGRVVHGEKVGRQLGFPTANIALKKQTPPLHGVFAVVARCDQTQKTWNAVANLGKRPTVNGLTLLLEVHLLDTTEELYGKHLSIVFLHFIRGEIKFASIDELKSQIGLDVKSAQEFFNQSF